MADANEPSDAPTTWDVSASPKTVVVIDDDLDLLDLLDLMVIVLQSAGHKAYGTTESQNGVSLA